jgi:hypothetical protein
MTSPLTTGLINGRFVRRSDLDSALRDAMFDMLQTHFSGVGREPFDADLNEKNWVILLEDDGGALRGFSTVLVYEDRSLGRPVTVVYSGDTIVARDWWGSPALPATWLRAVRHIVPVQEREAYWLLITSGFRTYRFLPVFFRRFHPAVTGGEADAHILQTLAHAKFGNRYDASRGIVTLRHPQVLVPELLEVPERRTADHHVAFFMQRNPGYIRGDELVCITRIAEDNLTAAGRRIWTSRSGQP